MYYKPFKLNDKGENDMGSATEKYEGLMDSLNSYRSVFIPFSISHRVYGFKETIGQLDAYAAKLLKIKDDYEAKLSKGKMSLQSYLETFSKDLTEEWVWCTIEEAPRLENEYQSMSQNGSTWTEKTGEYMTSGYSKGFWLRKSLSDKPEEHQVYGIGKVFGVYGSVKPTPESYPCCDLHELEVYQQSLKRDEGFKELSREGLAKVQEVENLFFKLRPELEALIPQVLDELIEEANERLALEERAQKAKEEQAKVVAALKKAGKPIPRNLR
jgi:hypothetical protein